MESKISVCGEWVSKHEWEEWEQRKLKGQLCGSCTMLNAITEEVM